MPEQFLQTQQKNIIVSWQMLGHQSKQFLHWRQLFCMKQYCLFQEESTGSQAFHEVKQNFFWERVGADSILQQHLQDLFLSDQ